MKGDYVSFRAVDEVLIDTWWNVNKFLIKHFFDICRCFNRYMVECESCML